METLNRNNATKSPAKTTKNLVEHVEHYKAVKADHVPANIVKTLNLASSKVNKSGKSPLKTVKVPVADGETILVPLILVIARHFHCLTSVMLGLLSYSKYYLFNSFL